MTGFIEIEIEALGKGSYRAWHADQVLIERSVDPEHDGARELVEAGADMDTTMITFARGGSMPHMIGRLGCFAGHRSSGNRTSVWPPVVNSADDAD